MKKALSVLFSLMLFSVLTFGTVKAVVIRDDFETLNTDIWSVGGTAGSYGTVEVTGGKLHLHLAAQHEWGGHPYNKYVESVPFNLTDNTVIEMKVKTAMSSTHVSLGFGLVDEAGNWVVEFYGFSDTNKYELQCGGQSVAVSPFTEYSVYRFVFGNGTVAIYRDGSEITSCAVDVQQVKIMFYTSGWNDGYADIYVDYVSFDDGLRRVNVSLKDGLTGKSLSGVTVKENGTVIGTIDDGGTLELAKGTHELIFEKSGYWSKTITVDVQNDTAITLQMYPQDYVIIASTQVSDVYQYSQGVATLSVQVVEGSGYGYSTKVAISGVEVSKVTWNGAVVNPGDDGKYYLGDIGSSPGELKIYFKAGNVLGNRSFRVTFITYDSLANMKANEYTITYSVQEPPFKVTLPSWKVGVNTVRVTDQSGTDRVISIILYDENGTEVYSDSQSLLSYGSVEFNVPIDSLDGYTLEVRSNDGISLYFDVTAQVPIVLKTETVQVSGSSGEVTVEISNSGNSVAYYKFIVEGEPIDNSTRAVEVSLAPGETKTINVPFKLKKDLTLDTYEATIKALDSQDTVVWSSNFVIKRSSGFALPISGASAEGLIGLGAVAVLGLGGLALVIKKRR